MHLSVIGKEKGCRRLEDDLTKTASPETGLPLAFCGLPKKLASVSFGHNLCRGAPFAGTRVERVRCSCLVCLVKVRLLRL